ncbi:hypothetical protein SLEP1_g37020 [Rubroshorea leprosula]|uniref:Uncharacterized protein n=1 Tax=Rubroshorea leprosula TaxID=152421 RepID=A0AAV5KTJ0_9ROSI|nr:hypothetical protein SLEP1_g37020 [Rubroshorea leprosula]
MVALQRLNTPTNHHWGIVLPWLTVLQSSHWNFEPSLNHFYLSCPYNKLLLNCGLHFRMFEFLQEGRFFTDFKSLEDLVVFTSVYTS